MASGAAASVVAPEVSVLLKVEELPETESGLEFVFLLNSPPALADSAASYKVLISAILLSGHSKETKGRSLVWMLPRCSLGTPDMLEQDRQCSEDYVW